ncbi:helix-turn-helix domain-containing protein [uncultured Chitinophaga sp.]|jgi:Predicted transcriptional regulators|uniref:winged helix-turn-helix transcriptional regulator n=1 Tax=uncultured Chitinophaga sp. TaxID=339340 RepID=UPI0026163F86|nr:helix-turn-helix domain-containing protein [uncultured Chitinophaga sp.]
MEIKKNQLKYHSAEECPITATIDVIGGKWKPPIIWLLLKGPMRFGEFSKVMPSIALKVLSRCLKELEADGIIIRKAYPEIPPRVEYSLSEKGESLREVMFLLSNWSRVHIMHQAAAE